MASRAVRLISVWLKVFPCLLTAIDAPAQASNEETTIVLHAHRFGNILNCQAGIGQFDCSEASTPRVNIPPGDVVAVYVFLRNHDELTLEMVTIHPPPRCWKSGSARRLQR